MASQQEKPRVTEIKVRMDCNGCVQKVKKALHGIIGITELYVDFTQQKVTIVGWADPEKIIKAIKKTRKTAVICLHAEQSAEQNSEAAPEDGSAGGGGEPPSEATNQVAEPEQTEQVPLQQDQPNEPATTENPPHEPNPPPESTGATSGHTTQPAIPKDEGEVHVVYHYPPDHGHNRYAYDQNAYQGYGGPWSHPEDPRYRREPSQIPGSPGSYNGPWAQPGVSSFRREPPQPPEPSEPHSGHWGNPGVPRFRAETPQPVSVNHSYNMYKPSPYVTEYAYPRPPPRNNTNYPRQGEFGPREIREYNYNTYRPPPSHLQTQEYNNTYRPSSGSVETHEYNTTTYRPSPGTVETRPIETQDYNSNTYRPSPRPVDTRPTETRDYNNTYTPSPSPVETRPTETREYINTYRPSPGPVETREYSNNTYRPSPGPIETRPTETYNYNTYRPSPYTTEYAYSRTPSGFNPQYGSPTPPSYYSSYSRPDNFNQEYYNGNHGNGNVTSMFSEENPNACTIV